MWFGIRLEGSAEGVVGELGGFGKGGRNQGGEGKTAKGRKGGKAISVQADGGAVCGVVGAGIAEGEQGVRPYFGLFGEDSVQTGGVE